MVELACEFGLHPHAALALIQREMGIAIEENWMLRGISEVESPEESS